MQQAQDFYAETDQLHDVLVRVRDDQFRFPTLFKGWSIDDIVRHLHFWNQMASLQLVDEQELLTRLGALMQERSLALPVFEKRYIGDLSGRLLLDAWYHQAQDTADEFSQVDPKQRLKWAGVEMGAKSSITARLMETWAHGQAIYDLLGIDRRNEDRIKNIVVLGINTFGWTYKVRGEAVPDQQPYVQLTAPSGELWSFGNPSDDERVEGQADEFCQVVTQTRHVEDTQLQVAGRIARDWMAKAQCFAGAATNPPEPGSRHKALCPL